MIPPITNRRSNTSCHTCAWVFLSSLVSLVSLRTAGAANLSQDLQADRAFATALWQRGEGLLWFQHMRRAAGTALCDVLRLAVPNARFCLSYGEACQPESWKMKDAVAVCRQNFSLLAAELRVLGGNAFAQEYGPLPGPLLLGSYEERSALRSWVVVLALRNPWARFWSQLRYELAGCLENSSALTLCLTGRMEEVEHWWSWTSHPDSVLGIPPETISKSPAVYVDNYYTRMLLNRTDTDGRALTPVDLEQAKMLLTHRVSAVVIVEDFAHSALQLACALGMDLEKAKSLLRRKVRPYGAQEGIVADVPREEAKLQPELRRQVRELFLRRNSYDFSLFFHAQRVAKRQLSLCGRLDPQVRAAKDRPTAEFEAIPEPSAPLEPMTLDEMFGCNGGSLDWNEETQNYLLRCPRSAEQHVQSWWRGLHEGEPVRQLGQPIIAGDCWKGLYTWAACCKDHFGPGGNPDCWDAEFTYARCCAPSAATQSQASARA